MNHDDLRLMRQSYDEKRILLCFNGPFSQGLIEEIGNALRTYLASDAATSSALADVFACYIEITQNIRSYARSRGYDDAAASATVVIGRNDEHRYEILAGNNIEAADAGPLVARIEQLKVMDKTQLKTAYKEQLRREPTPGGGAGLGLIDIARKASAPLSCSLRDIPGDSRQFFSLRVVI
ncbi:biofilm regulation protein kinase SiaB [Solimonas flava]|uniref:biofilm regulation protein kinase SiaB n=1 Tax=Solimonas flava TaxID=415849 RepID=UPI0003F9AEF5|nr:biofilm regulation protein kinase SiaB [Solimonas flava]